MPAAARSAVLCSRGENAPCSLLQAAATRLARPLQQRRAVTAAPGCRCQRYAMRRLVATVVQHRGVQTRAGCVLLRWWTSPCRACWCCPPYRCRCGQLCAGWWRDAASECSRLEHAPTSWLSTQVRSQVMPAAAATRRRCRSSACAASLVAASASVVRRDAVQCCFRRQRTHVTLAGAAACRRRRWCPQQQRRRCQAAVRAPPRCWPGHARCGVLRPVATRVVSTGVHAGDAPRCSHDTPMSAAARSAVLCSH